MARRQATPYERFQWFRYRRNPHDPGLTISYVYALSGAVDQDLLNDALRDTVSTVFPQLPSYFTEAGDSLEVRTRSVPHRVLRRCEHRDDLLRAGGLDAAGQELYRFSYWQDAPDSLVLRLDFSHLVFDGGCYAPFCAALSARWRGEQPSLEPAVPVRSRTDPAATTAYWRAQLSRRGLHQPLPFCFPVPDLDGHPVAVKETLAGEGADRVHRFLRHHEVSLLQFVVAVTGALVHAYGDGDEQSVMVAHTVDTRTYGAPYGCHTNLLPLWLDLSAQQTALGLLDQVRTRREELRDHQGLATLDLLALAAAGPGRPEAGGSVLNLVVNSSSAMLPTAVPQLRGVDVAWLRKPDTGSSTDVAVNFSADAEGIHFSFDSSTRLMSPEALSALATNFLRVAGSVTADPHLPLSRCDISRPTAPAAEGPVHAGPDPRGLGAVLADSARHNADRVAVVDARRSLTYRDLLDVTDRLRRAVAAVGDPDGPVGVLLERSAAIPVSYLTALRLRRTFVPMDPRLPDRRLASMGAAADVRVLLVDAVTRDRAAYLFPHARLHEVDAFLDSRAAPVAPAGDDDPAGGPADQDRTAYVMFTSGSTGTPKGVAVSEGNLANFLLSVREDPGMVPEDRVPALTPVGFDISLLEILLPLLCGAAVEVLSEEARLSATLLAERIRAGRATFVQATPSTWRILKAAGWRADRPMTLLCGGEALDAELAEYLLDQGGSVYNMYGPTEATIWASWQRVTDARRVHLGQPAHNTRYYVVDDGGRSVAPGMCGELVIAGECVGQGYLNAPSTPFHTLPDGSRAYRTGDLVRYESPSRITYVSRTDGQRKVNGYRIELGEVAAGVRAHAPSATVFAVVRTRPEPHLRCFVWLPADQDLDTGALLERCQHRLPYYMMPKAVHRLRQIPLTANGKADVKRLAQAPLTDLDLYPQSAGGPPAPGARPADAATAPRGPLAELGRLVAEELGIPVPDADQPLGYQGVNSLGYNVLAAAISERYGIVVHAHEFYRMNTLRNVAGTVARLTAGDRPGGPAESVRSTGPRRHPAEAAPAAGPGTGDRLAVVGLSAVLPGGSDPQEFWEALVAGTDSVGPADAGRGLPGEIAGFIHGVRGFDARFFSVSPLEASWMDPRQRLLLQSAWHALEDAGYAPHELRGSRTGCYIAATGSDYALLQARAEAAATPYSLVGHSLSLIANRLSSWFDWHGPSMTLDTACSGSLVALVKACRDLRAGVCDTALVGGVNLILDPQINEGLRSARFLSPDHRCATFDASANGYVRGEGYGSFLVKRLDDALAAGDHVLAVVESVAENHGGRANSVTAPNPDAQYRLLLDAYTPELAARTGYIETHGTGTELGDAIEIDALKQAWEHLVPGGPEGPVWLGAVKTHIGHLEPAAGVASVAKVTKVFEHGTLPANLHFRKLNPAIPLRETPFEVLEKTVTRDDGTHAPLVAGISSFGFGGSNAHVVLSEPPRRPAPPAARGERYLVPLSARSPQALRRLVAALAGHLDAGRLGDDDLPDLSYTLCRGREHFAYRRAWLVGSVGALTDALRTAGEPVRVKDDQQPSDTAAPTPELAHRHYLTEWHIDLDGLFAERRPRRLRLPGYPFDETDYWFTDRGSRT